MKLMSLLLTGLAVIALALMARAQPAPAQSPAPQIQAPAAAAPAAAVVPVPVPIPSPEATRYYRSGNVLWIVASTWGLLLPALLLFSGFSARLRDIARRLGKYWYFMLVIYFALLALTLFVLDLPLDYYSDYLRPHAYGLSSQALGKWVHDELLSLGIGLLVGALLIWIPYLLFKRSRKRWWFYTWLASIPVMLCLAFVEPIWLEPLFNDFGPMQDKVLEGQILELAHRAGIDGANVYEVNKSVDTNELNAYVTGIGATKRIVLWDTIIRQFTADELLLVMGHEMGHYVLGHVWKELIFVSLVLLAALWFIHLTAAWTLRRFGQRTGVTELADVASLPLLMLLFGVFSLIFQPAPLAFSRHFEHEADRFGLEITHDNHACAMAFVKFVQHDLSYPTPGLLFKIWRSSHPPLDERIGFCNRYHPWLDGQPGRYDGDFIAAPAASATPRIPPPPKSD
jgi:STE24 endopeptidase